MSERKDSRRSPSFKNVAGGGLLDRRAFLGVGSTTIGALAGGIPGAASAFSLLGYDVPDWMKTPGRSISTYGR